MNYNKIIEPFVLAVAAQPLGWDSFKTQQLVADLRGEMLYYHLETTGLDIEVEAVIKAVVYVTKACVLARVEPVIGSVTGSETIFELLEHLEAAGTLEEAGTCLIVILTHLLRKYPIPADKFSTAIAEAIANTGSK